MSPTSTFVIPAKVGIQLCRVCGAHKSDNKEKQRFSIWIPAFAGMTIKGARVSHD